LKIFDGAGNNVILTDAFYILKDTNPPTITKNIITGGLTTWYNADPGNIIDIDFNDQEGLSLLTTAQFVAYSGAEYTGNKLTEWTDIFNLQTAPIGSKLSYTSNWAIGISTFALLQTGTNYITIRVYDVAGNVAISTDAFKVLKDTAPPAAITTLTALAGNFCGSIDLSWTVPEDIGCGQVGAFLIKYATYPINAENYDTAMTWENNIVPGDKGDNVSITITGLDIGTTYYFCVRSRDKVPSPPNPNFNWSPLSNVASCMPQKESIYINEIYAHGAGGSWVEIYNGLSTTQSLYNWRLVYNQGTIDSPGAESVIWAGGTGVEIPAKGFYVIGGLNLDGSQSYHIKLLNQNGLIVDKVQWPVLDTGQSYSRITDGNNTFFEIDPTPTQGYANHITTGVVKINEIDYASVEEFVELYNMSSDTQVLTSWYLRNSDNKVFKFTRKILPYSFTGIDFSSIDNDGYSWSAIFGNNGLKNAADFVVLENAAGQVVDRVTWQSGTTYVYRDYKAQLIPYNTPAPGNLPPPSTIGRQPAEGSDSDIDSTDFITFTAPSYGARNNNPTPATNNALYYPTSNIYLPRSAKIELALGENSSSGNVDTLWFIRTGGAADTKSPHIYTLSSLGIDLSATSVQVTSHTWVNVEDIDGYTLSTGTIYKMILNTDTSSGRAPQIVVSTVTYDAVIHTVDVYSNARKYGNDNMRESLLKINIKSESIYNALELESVYAQFVDTNSIPLTTAQAQNLFGNIYVILDNLNDDTTGIYYQDIDTVVVAQLSNNEINLDLTGGVTIYITNPNAAESTIPPNSERIYYLVVEFNNNASEQRPNSCCAKIDPENSVIVRESISNVIQETYPKDIVISDTITVIAPASPPTGTYWPYQISSSSPIYSGFSGYNADASWDYDYLYVGSDDGKIYSLNKNGTLRWTFTPSSAPQKIHSVPIVIPEGSTPYIYFLNNSGDIYKIRDDGSYATQVWVRDLPAGNWCSSLGWDYSGYLYVGGADGRVYKLSQQDGTTPSTWVYDATITGELSTIPAIDAFSPGVNSLWIASSEGKIYKLNLADGVVQSSTMSLSGVVGSPWLDAGFYNASLNSFNLYWTSLDGKLRCRTASNLTTIPADWSDLDVGAPIRTSPFLTYEAGRKYVYFGADNGKLYKVDAASGTIVWTYQTGGPIRTTPVVYGGYVYFGSDDGYVYCISASSGNLRPKWPIFAGSPVRGMFFIDTVNKRLYFGTYTGKLMCISIQ
jgi:outer membrane protein assembly factor BamB